MNQSFTHSTSQRLISLDAMRGFTIAAMVIVNDPGSWDHVYAPLLHAEWNCLTTTDLIYPFFLFFVGMSIALAYTKRLDAGDASGPLQKKLLIMAAKIFLLGLFLALWPEFNFSELRWPGVLQRIALVFVVCGFLFLNTNRKQLITISIIILLLYWVIMVFIPVPGIGFPDLSMPDKNWANWLDNMLLPGRLYRGTWDPEGFLSTFPAIVTGISGMLVGQVMLKTPDIHQKLFRLFFIGFIMLGLGAVWNWFFPINKHIWTSSYVLYTSGLATMSLAAFYYVVDVKGYHRWTLLGRVYGANSLSSYVLAGMLTLVFYDDIFGGMSLNDLFMENMTQIGMAHKLASLLYAVIYMLIIFVPAYILYKKKFS